MEPVERNNSKLREKINFNNLVTCSKKMVNLIALAKKTSNADVTVLINGESGTGKELIAQAIHNNSSRKNGPFIELSCAGIPDTLLESELFGHEKGAFTDAVSKKRGKFELANEGTLFLDEIGDLSMAAQAKTLRAVEEKTFERVGGEVSISVNCRIIAATNKKLLTQVKNGSFREDLYYRLHEVCLDLPPLRERKEDIPILTEHFLKEFNQQFHKNIKGVSDVTLSHLMKHNWPGNVRELKSIIKGGTALARRDVIWLEDLPFKIELVSEENISQVGQDFSLKLAEKKHILDVLNYTKWNKANTAGLLKISRPTLDKKIEEYNLKVESPPKT